LLAHIKAKFPQVNIHGFSPSEFIHFREVFNEPLEKIIGDFQAAGLGSIPGAVAKSWWTACASEFPRSKP
jgi:cyclic dehypoxanthinyl futalosine synthase